MVPFDFTDATRQALRYTITLASNGGGKILVVHVVRQLNEVADAEGRLNEEVAVHSEHADMIETKVVVGSIFEDLNNVGEVEGASLIVMGVHNPSGLKRIFRN